MAKEYIILLKDFKFGRCGLVNQFLIDNGLEKDMRVVIAQYERPPTAYTRGGKTYYSTDSTGSYVQERCIGLEVVNEKKAFYYALKGHANLTQQIKNYETQHG